MKSTLAFDQNAGQFKCDVGTPSKRFYLGSDAAIAQARKEKLAKFWERCGKWTDETLGIAHQIRKGEPVKLSLHPDESEAQHSARETRVVEMARHLTTVEPTVTLDDLHRGDIELLKNQVKRLEGLVREQIGDGAVVGDGITIRKALDAWHEFRRTTELSPEDGQPTEHMRTEKNNVELVKRVVADMPLSRLNYIELKKWCKAIANRPTSLKTGKPIRPKTAYNCLKVIRMFVRWASHNYGWRKPEDWHDATRALAKTTLQEKRDRAQRIEQHYTFEEIGTLWSFALPSERILILLALNFGFAQAEIIALEKGDLSNGKLKSFRGKSSVYSQWDIWPETKALAESNFENVPRRRQHISNFWQRLLGRVQKDHPDFKMLSFKWLRKTGSSMIRKIADGETASLYLSHGEVTDDNQLEVYAAKNWERLGSALASLRENLLPHIQAEARIERNYIPRSKIDKIKDGWRAGLKAEEIMRLTAASRATVYRYKPEAA